MRSKTTIILLLLMAAFVLSYWQSNFFLEINAQLLGSRPYKSNTEIPSYLKNLDRSMLIFIKYALGALIISAYLGALMYVLNLIQASKKYRNFCFFSYLSLSFFCLLFHLFSFLGLEFLQTISLILFKILLSPLTLLVFIVLHRLPNFNETKSNNERI